MSTLRTLDPVMARQLEVSQNLATVQDVLAATLEKYPSLAPAATQALQDFIHRIEIGVDP